MSSQIEKQIQEFDWRQFQDYYGEQNPTPLPILLLDLTSHSARSREIARGWLGEWPIESLHLIGCLGAMPLAIRYVLQLLDQPETPEKADLLKLVVGWRKAANEFCTFEKYYEQSEAEFRQEILDAFATGASIFLQMLTVEDPRVRRLSAEALSRLPAGEWGEHLLEQFRREEEVEVKNALIQAFGFLQFQEAIPELQRLLQLNDSPTKVLSAAALCRLCPLVPELAIQVLAESALLNWKPHENKVAEKISNVAWHQMYCLPEEPWEAVVDKLILLIQFRSDSECIQCFLFLFTLVIPGV